MHFLQSSFCAFDKHFFNNNNNNGKTDFIKTLNSKLEKKEKNS